jgi:hypothetical protein
VFKVSCFVLGVGLGSGSDPGLGLGLLGRGRRSGLGSTEVLAESSGFLTLDEFTERGVLAEKA